MLPVSDYVRVRDAIQSGSPIALKTSNYSAPHRDYVDRVLSLYLYDMGLVHLHNNIAYCVHELAGNARNALMKRIWFREHALDINDRETYTASVPEFRKAVFSDPSRYLAALESSPYFIRFVFTHTADQIRIIVENNTSLLSIERERIEAKIIEAKNFHSMADAYGAMIDFSEGAGLGLAMVVIILRNLGLSDDSLLVGETGAEFPTTRSEILIDRNEVGRIDSNSARNYATRH